MSYTTISFPGLGLELNPGFEFSIGPLNIRYYGMLIAFGLVLATLYGLRRGKEFGLKEDDILDGALAIIPFAVICTRAYYCIFAWDEFRDNPIEVFYIWQGGLAIYGGVIGAALGIIVFCRIKKIALGTVLDLVALGFLIGQSIGRWGNFFNREAFGAETDFFLRMGLKNGFTGDVTYHHPTFLYESLWNAVGFIGLHFLSKRKKYDGQIALGYAAWYGLGRAIIEGLRTDSLYWGNFRVSQLVALASFVTATTVLIVLHFRPHDPAKLFVNRIAAQEAEAEALAAAAEANEASTEETENEI